MTEVRYGYQEGEVDGLTVEPAIRYPNTEDASADRGPDRDVFDAEPALFYVRGRVRESDTDDDFRPRNIQLAQNAVTQVAGRNTRRKRLYLWIDATTADLTVNISCQAVGYPFVQLTYYFDTTHGVSPKLDLELTATGPVYAFTETAGAFVNVIEESYR